MIRWSLGTLIYEMLTGIPPFYDKNVKKMYYKIAKAPLRFPSYIQPDARDLIARLLDRNTDTRLGCGPGNIHFLHSL